MRGAVSSRPAITKFPLSQLRSGFLLQVSDGATDVMGNDKMADIVHEVMGLSEYLKQSTQNKAIAITTLKMAIGYAATDNVTVLTRHIQPNETHN